MSGKVPVIYRPPNPAKNEYYRKLAEEYKKRQMAPPHIGFPSKGGKRRTMKRKSMRRKTHKRRRC